MSIDYTQEKLWQAVETLVTGRGSIQERLRYASDSLVRLRGGDSACPEHPEFRERLARVLDRLSGGPAAILSVTSGDGTELAKEVFTLFCRARLGPHPGGLRESPRSQ